MFLSQNLSNHFISMCPGSPETDNLAYWRLLEDLLNIGNFLSRLEGSINKEQMDLNYFDLHKQIHT